MSTGFYMINIFWRLDGGKKTSHLMMSPLAYSNALWHTEGPHRCFWWEQKEEASTDTIRGFIDLPMQKKKSFLEKNCMEPHSNLRICQFLGFQFLLIAYKLKLNLSFGPLVGQKNYLKTSPWAPVNCNFLKNLCMEHCDFNILQSRMN